MSAVALQECSPRAVPLLQIYTFVFTHLLIWVLTQITHIFPISICSLFFFFFASVSHALFLSFCLSSPHYPGVVLLFFSPTQHTFPILFFFFLSLSLPLYLFYIFSISLFLFPFPFFKFLSRLFFSALLLHGPSISLILPLLTLLFIFPPLHLHFFLCLCLSLSFFSLLLSCLSFLCRLCG